MKNPCRLVTQQSSDRSVARLRLQNSQRHDGWTRSTAHLLHPEEPSNVNECFSNPAVLTYSHGFFFFFLEFSIQIDFLAQLTAQCSKHMRRFLCVCVCLCVASTSILPLYQLVATYIAKDFPSQKIPTNNARAGRRKLVQKEAVTD